MAKGQSVSCRQSLDRDPNGARTKRWLFDFFCSLIPFYSAACLSQSQFSLSFLSFFFSLSSAQLRWLAVEASKQIRRPQ